MTAVGPRAEQAESEPSNEAHGSIMPVLSHPQILVVLIGLMLGMFVAAVSQTIVATALPTIIGELGGQDQLAWVVSATLLTATASTPIWGKLSTCTAGRSCSNRRSESSWSPHWRPVSARRWVS